MTTVAYPLYNAQYQAPDGTMLYGTAQETPYGWQFTDERGTAPFYTDKRALHLCGQIALIQEQDRRDLATAWTRHLLKNKCRIAA